MFTISDLEKCGDDEALRKTFVENAIQTFKDSPEYKMAVRATEYYKHHNPDILEVKKVIYDQLGQPHEDNVSPNHQIMNGYYPEIIDGSVSHLLANGITCSDEKAKEALGKDIDAVTVEILTDAKNCGVSYGYYDGKKKRTIHFKYTEFVPILDDYTGALAAGIRFTQIDINRPMVATLYEKDGYTVYVREPSKELELKSGKKQYDSVTLETPAEGELETIGEESSELPIYPLYNINKESCIVGNLNTLIAIDLINSGLVNTTVQDEIVYWVLHNFGGMSPQDDINFWVDLVKRHVIHTEGEDSAEPHQINPPFEANTAAASRLRQVLYESMSGVDVETLRAGNLTATAIRAAYTKLRAQSGKLEFKVLDFLNGLLKLAGYEDETATLHWYELTNDSEAIQNVVASAQWMSEKDVTKKLYALNGMIDDYDEERIEQEKAAAMMAQMAMQAAE